MILYIHGFASSGLGDKANYFRDFFAQQQQHFVAPSLPVIPSLAISTLENLIETLQAFEPVHLMGSSLGAYYGLWLAEQYRLKLVLINPALRPVPLLGQYTGSMNHHFDGSSFTWTEAHTQSLAQYEIAPSVELQRRCLLLTQQGDEVLDYQQAVDILPGAQHIIEPHGDHSFRDIARHGQTIQSFLLDPSADTQTH